MIKLDLIDIKIINFLQKNARMQIKDIAKEVYLSSPAVSTRIERLEKAGIIKGYHAMVDMVKMNYYITAFIDVAMPPNRKEEFYAYVENVKNVIESSCVTGEFSMHLKTVFHTTQDLDEFVMELHKFGPTRTHIVFSSNIEPRGVQFTEKPRG